MVQHLEQLPRPHGPVRQLDHRVQLRGTWRRISISLLVDIQRHRESHLQHWNSSSNSLSREVFLHTGFHINHLIPRNTRSELDLYRFSLGEGTRFSNVYRVTPRRDFPPDTRDDPRTDQHKFIYVKPVA